MTTLSGQSIQRLELIAPTLPRTRCPLSGLTFGLGPAGYDVRVREAVTLPPGGFALASTVERFDLPPDIQMTVHDKSTLARRGLAVQATVAEPGWRGYLTMELTNHQPIWQMSLRRLRRLLDVSHLPSSAALTELMNELEAEQAAWNAERTIILHPGQPVAQIILHRLDEPALVPYAGRYQNQPPEPVSARFLKEGEVG